MAGLTVRCRHVAPRRPAPVGQDPLRIERIRGDALRVGARIARLAQQLVYRLAAPPHDPQALPRLLQLEGRRAEAEFSGRDELATMREQIDKQRQELEALQVRDILTDTRRTIYLVLADGDVPTTDD